MNQTRPNHNQSGIQSQNRNPNHYREDQVSSHKQSTYHNDQDYLRQLNANRSIPRTGNHRIDHLQQQTDFSKRRFNSDQQGYYQQPNDNYQANYRVRNKQVKKSPLANWYNRRLRKQAKKQPGELPKGKPQLFATYLILFLLMIIFIGMSLPIGRANKIITKGNVHAPSKGIIAATGIHPTDKKKAIKEQSSKIVSRVLEIDPYIKNIEFDYDDWRGLNINVTESVLVGKIEIDQKIYGILSNGAIIETEEADNINQMPWLVDFTNESLQSLGKNMSQISPELLMQMDTIYHSNNPDKPHVIEVLMVDGNIIRASLATFAEKVQYYPQMVQQTNGQKGLFNLEVGAYFTPEDQNNRSIKLDANLDN